MNALDHFEVAEICVWPLALGNLDNNQLACHFYGFARVRMR